MTNRLFYGDNLEMLRQFIPDNSVDLCYIDPPFNSNRSYYQLYNNQGNQWKTQAFTDTWAWDDFAEVGFSQIINNYRNKFTTQTIDLMAGLSKVLSKGSLLAYLVSITLRVTEIHRILKPNGSFYLHCDPTAGHYLKLVLDAVFCPSGGDFKNEIVWCYSIGGKSNKKFAKKHDIILFYTKNAETYTFNEKAASICRKPNSHMKVRIDAAGRQYQQKTDKKTGKLYKYYLDEGKIAEDYWTDIETLNRQDKERLGYPTQKPEALLDRIIKVSSNEGDVVLDAYCGCGTTLAVAQRLNRQWIGIDITYQSISLVLKRLENSFGSHVLSQIQLIGIPKDRESAIALASVQSNCRRTEYEKWAILTYSNNQALIQEKKGSTPGIEGIVYFLGEHGELHKIILQVKRNNINFSNIEEMHKIIINEKASLVIYIVLKKSRAVIEKAQSYGFYYCKINGNIHPRLQLVTIQEILEEGKRLKSP
ncbi:DNA-methyltransferase [Microcoleus sp. FACHB-672]|uniref:DNA-methyltransferase n=1 Tax=Microcoleus sp. FACHB-672 TaxID=2692825 RepID=UPI001688FD36|nr:site-specific DNA-methyltransferase [Microcoleus sp. FACHB-672]MBD2043069.1 site-specific DNA-methyltransferase [Microcoleus sp. FACHB-672]